MHKIGSIIALPDNFYKTKDKTNTNIKRKTNFGTNSTQRLFSILQLQSDFIFHPPPGRYKTSDNTIHWLPIGSDDPEPAYEIRSVLDVYEHLLPPD